VHTENDCVAIEFIDDGDGICDDALDKIFEPFYTTKEVGKGTGLGLAIVYGITKEHKGNIEYLPNGKGSAFRLTLPAMGPEALYN
jgi:signal transduction histidine kinase